MVRKTKKCRSGWTVKNQADEVARELTNATQESKEKQTLAPQRDQINDRN